MGLNALSVCLFEEREALDEVAFKLEQQYLVLCAGRHALVERTTAEFRRAVQVLDAASRRRADLVAAAAVELRLTATPTLGGLADAVEDEDERHVLEEHRRAMVELVQRIGELSTRNRELLARNLAATTDALALLGAEPSYSSTGEHLTGAVVPRILDARA